MELEELIIAINSIVALVVSITALIYTVRTYLLKSGLNVRGSYLMMSSIYCEDKYVGSVTIENLKDRAIVILKIYLQVGRNYYITIDDFEDKPLIVNPFEVFHKEYDPIDYYDIGSGRILLDSLLGDDKIKMNLVLNTTDGKYKIKTLINIWDPFIDFLKNHYTFIIDPIRTRFKDRSYGGNVLYLVEFIWDNEKCDVQPIYPNDHERKIFKSFRLTKESLESKNDLESYIAKQKEDGTLSCTSFKVYDIAEWRKENHKLDQKKVIQAVPIGRFKYYIFGRILTIIDDYKLRVENRKRRKSK